MHRKMFTCGTCGSQWTENYCPACARTIERLLSSQPSERISRGHFGVNSKLWLSLSIPPFLLLWLYQPPLDKGGSVLARLWVDAFRGSSDISLWGALAFLTVVFAGFAALIGFAAHGIIIVFRQRRKQISHGTA